MDNGINELIAIIQSDRDKAYPNLKGFNRAWLYRTVQFYEEYRDNIFVSTLSRQIGWNNNILILSSTKSIEQKELSNKLVENYKKGIDSLVYAVCGFRKTRNT